MLNIVLYEPEIPPNTGNIMRLCANTGCKLHLIEPLGFKLDEKRLRRAGLDYRDFAEVTCYPNLSACRLALDEARFFAISTRANQVYTTTRYQPGDALLFGPETRGLPSEVLDALPEDRKLRIPMLAGSRSLNLSNAVAILTYEAMRQLGFHQLS